MTEKARRIPVGLSAAKRLGQGMLIGLSNIVPGVSGGTMALALGIYPRLLDAVHKLDLTFVRDALGLATLRPAAFRRFRTAFLRVDGAFLAWLGGGAVLAALALSRLMSWLLEHHFRLAYAFFFGLILASTVFPCRALRRPRLRHAAIGLLAAALTVALTLASQGEKARERAEIRTARATAASDIDATADTEPAHTQPSFRLVSLRNPGLAEAALFFGGGALAIATMILPGVSGSFMLLLVGLYFPVLRAVDQRELLPIALFILGGLVGLLGLARLLRHLLRRFHNGTMSFMIGLMIGSLWNLWPLKHWTIVNDTRAILGNRFPADSGEVWPLLTVAVCAVIIVRLCDRASHYGFLQKRMG